MPTITIPDFTNEPLSDFSDPELRVWDKIGDALHFARAMVLGQTYPVIAGNYECRSNTLITRRNPSHTDEIIGHVSLSRPCDIDRGIHALETGKTLKQWMRASYAERGAHLMRVAEKFRERRFFFVALMMLEVGKSAPEADAEVSEAIDLIRWYALYAPFLEEFSNKTLHSPRGEKNSAAYIPAHPFPICASIQPWNFPLAISVGPAAAALVSGYAVLYKPSEQSSITGYHIARTFYEAGIPRELFQFFPGYGDTGSYLVRHPSVSAVAFTGSNKVRQDIQRAIAEFNTSGLSHIPPRERHEKRSLALESGGKNAIIVDSDADFDDAVVGVCDSAFGFSGQKCSACSRLIVVDDKGEDGKRYETFMKRLSERVKSLHVGSPEDPKNKVGPLVDEEAVAKFRSYVAHAHNEGCRLVAEGSISDSTERRGYFVPPAIFDHVGFSSRLAQEEVFGPLLSVFCVSTFQGALSLANDTEFALTAGVYSRSPKHIECAKEGLRAGNIYVNRKITGAQVGRQPFGGFGMSGNGTKAGGWDYLLSFFPVSKVVTENTMRRGIPLE